MQGGAARGEEELRALWRAYEDSHDPTARERLILTYAPLVKFVAGRLAAGLPNHVEEADLISYGLVGLIGAVERYEPERGVRFETFAVSRIRGAIIDELRNRYGAFQSSEMVGGGESSPGSPIVPFNYTITFENATVDAVTMIAFSDPQQGGFVNKIDSITILDSELGDLTFPAEPEG